MEARRVVKDEKGAVTILVTIALVALLLSLAVVVDVGLVFQERRQLQTATDAAALAAAMDIGEGKTEAESRSKAIEYVSSNANIPPSEIAVSFPAANRVHVSASTDRSIFFANFMGRGTARVKAESTAGVGAANSVAYLTPFIVPLQKVAQFKGEANTGTFELGEDRPMEAFSKVQSISGDTITYTITYNNTSNKIENATVKDTIPEGTVFVSGSISSGGSYDTSNKQITWSFSSVMPNDYRLMSFQVKATSALPGSVTNTASLNTGSKTLTASSGGNTPQQGYFWLTDFNNGSGGVPQYDEWLRHGYAGYVKVGDLANGTGMKTSLKEALEWRQGDNPKMLVPVYSYTEGGGSPGTYHVVGFAEFMITSFNLSANPKTISGYFTDGTVAKGIPGPEPDGYFGVNAVWLVQ